MQYSNFTRFQMLSELCIKLIVYNILVLRKSADHRLSGVTLYKSSILLSFRLYFYFFVNLVFACTNITDIVNCSISVVYFGTTLFFCCVDTALVLLNLTEPKPEVTTSAPQVVVETKEPVKITLEEDNVTNKTDALVSNLT